MPDIEKDIADEENSPESRIIEALWKVFSSMKTAIVLLLVLAIASAFGTFRPSPDVYKSPWYIALLGLVFLNLLICSINRFGSVWKRTFTPIVKVSPEQLRAMKATEQFTTSFLPDEAATKVATTLRALAYRVMLDKTDEGISVYATKGRLRIWGPYLTHVSVLIIILSAMAGIKFGHGGAMLIPEGEVASSFYIDGTEKPLGFAIKLHDFEVVLDPQGNPSAYRSDIEIFDKNRSVLRKVIDVNHPLSYKGMSFIQASYGPMVKLSFRQRDGEVTYTLYEVVSTQSEHGLIYDIPDRMTPRVMTIGKKRLAVFMHDFIPNFTGQPSNLAKPVPDPAGLIYVNEHYGEDRDIKNWKSLGWVTTRRPARYDGIEVSISCIDYSKLDISRNPALPVLYTGFALLLVGIYISFYVRHNVIRASVASAVDGSSVLVGATSTVDATELEREFRRIKEVLNPNA